MQTDNNAGFSLIELLVVVAVIGVLALFAIPQLTNVKPNMTLKSVARDLYSDFQTARILAVKLNLDTAIIFDTGAVTYDVCDDWNTTDSACDGNSRTVVLNTSTYGIGYGHGSGALGATQATDTQDAFPLAPDDDVSFLNNTVVFSPQGLIRNAGYVYLDHSSGTVTYAIGAQTSGVIKLLKWTTGGWE